MKTVALGLLFSLPLVSCGSGSSDKSSAEPAPGPSSNDSGFIDENTPVSVDLLDHMVFDRFVSPSAKDSLVRDFKRIERFDLSSTAANDKALKKLLAVSDLSGATMSGWLKERVRYLLSPDLGKYRIGTLVAQTKSFEVSQLPSLSAEDTKNMAAAMMGTSLYQIGKIMREEDPRVNYLLLEVNNNWIHLNTQRNGVMQIGPALFDPNYMPNDTNAGAYANTAVRVETLFHEARHADGNELSGSFGFYHADCPADAGVAKEFIGKPACDDNANGPYTIGAQVLKAYIAKCGELCSAEDRSVLQAFMLDSLSRVVKRSNGSLPNLDATPESGFAKVDISSFSLIPSLRN